MFSRVIAVINTLCQNTAISVALSRIIEIIIAQYKIIAIVIAKIPFTAILKILLSEPTLL